MSTQPAHLAQQLKDHASQLVDNLPDMPGQLAEHLADLSDMVVDALGDAWRSGSDHARAIADDASERAHQLLPQRRRRRSMPVWPLIAVAVAATAWMALRWRRRHATPPTAPTTTSAASSGDGETASMSTPSGEVADLAVTS